jgi:hypothetical protein
MPNGGMNVGMNGSMNSGPLLDSIPGWEHLGIPNAGHYLGPTGMPPPHMVGYPGGIPPHPHLMGMGDPSLIASREGELDPYGAPGGLPYGMSIEALHGRMSGGMDDRGMGLYMPPRNPLPPPPGGPNGHMPWQYSATSPQLGQLGSMGSAMGSMGSPSLPLGQPQSPPMGADLRRYPRGNSGVDSVLDPNLLPWGQGGMGGIPDMPYPVSSAYLERMNGLPDGRPPLVGVQCGGPTEFEGY